jgi:type II secretory pathway component GspD/PulD (secretin)
VAILGDRKALLCAILVGLLLSAGTAPVVQARSPRAPAANGGWQPMPRREPSGSIKVPPPVGMVGPSMSRPSPGPTASARSFSRSMDWIDLGNGVRIRHAPPGGAPLPKPDLLSPWPIPAAPPAMKRPEMSPLFQLTPPPATSTPSGPVTGAQPQGLTPPAPPTDPNANPEYILGGNLKLPPGVDMQIRQLDFRDTALADALRSLAQLVNINLMLHSAIQGNVTILFSNITVEEAFNTLLRNYDLAFTWQGNILSIFPIANAPLVTTIFNIQNTNAAQVKEIIDRLLTPDRGKSEVDARTNSLMVTDTQHVLDKIRKLLPQIDVKEQAVEVTSRPVTEVFYLDYVDAGNLTEPIRMIAPAAQIQPYSSSQASMAAVGGGGGAGGGRMDMMIITDTQSNLDRIRELIGKLDVAPIQVTIDAHIYEIDLNEEERLGINWQKQIPIPGTDENVFDMSVAPETSDAGGTGVFRWGSLNVQQFRALLAMLKTKSFAKVLSNPVITTLNNRQANITVGQAIPYVSASQVNAQTGNVTNTISQANANITLQVTPSVTGNDEVFLDINPTISSVLGFTTLGGNSTPNLSNRSAQTQVIIKNNHTIVIGGMIKTDKNETVAKVPFLGDLPGIGQLFRKKTWKESRTELIIFITPHIVRQQGHTSARLRQDEAGAPRLSLQP